MAALSAASSVFVGKAVQATQIRAKAPKASVVVKASASDNSSKVVLFIFPAMIWKMLLFFSGAGLDKSYDAVLTVSQSGVSRELTAVYRTEQRGAMATGWMFSVARGSIRGRQARGAIVSAVVVSIYSGK